MNFVAKVILLTFASVLAVIAIGTVAGISLFFGIQNIQLDNTRNEYKIQFLAKAVAIEDTIVNTARSVHTIKSLFEINQNLEPYGEFLTFMEESQNNIIGAFSLGWISHVNNSDRNSFINSFRTYGREYSNFSIIVRPPSGVLPAPVAPTYNVLSYIYPLGPNLGVLGMNLDVEPVRANTIQRSLVSQQDAVSSIIYLPHAKYQQPGILYLTPSFNGEQIQGFGVGVFIIGDMISNAMADLMTKSNIIIFDTGLRNISNTELIDGDTSSWESSGYNTSTFLWTNNGEYGSTFGTAQHIHDIQETINSVGFSYVYPIQVGDRVWNIVVSPTSSFLTKNDTGLKWVGLVCAIVFSLFVSVVISLTSSGIYIRQRNERRIHDLEIQTEKRQAEDYKKLFNSVARIENARKHILDTIPDLVIVVNKQGRIIYANTAFLNTLGYTELEINNYVEIHGIFVQMEKDFFQQTMKIDFEETVLESRMKQQISVTYCSFLLDIDEKEFQFDESIQGRISTATNHQKESGVYVIVARDLRDTKALQGELQNHKAILQQMISSSEFEKRWEEDKGRPSIDGTFGFRQKFLQFCTKNHCEENVYFIKDVEKYKELADYDQRVKAQQQIMDTYIKVTGNRQLNLMSHLQKEMEVKAKRSHGEIDLFDKVLIAVKTVIINDVYPRYVEDENKRGSTSSVTNTMSTGSTK